MPRPHRFLRSRLAGWTVALGLGLGSTAADAADDPSGKLGLQVGTLVNVQCPAPDLPHIVAVRSLGDIADWFNPRAFEAAIADELPVGSEVGGRPVIYFDNANERKTRDRLAGDYGSLFLVELVPAEQRVDASLSGHCLSGTIEEMDLRVVSASPPRDVPIWPPSTANTPRETGDRSQQMRAADRPPLTEEGGTTWTTSVSPPPRPPIPQRETRDIFDERLEEHRSRQERSAAGETPRPAAVSPPQPARSEPPKPPRTDPATPSNPRPTASSKTLPRLKMRNVGTIRARVPSCSAALHDYETSRHGIVISAVLGTLGVGILTAGISTGAHPAMGGGLGLALYGTGMPYFLISAHPKQEAKKCLANAGYQLGH